MLNMPRSKKTELTLSEVKIESQRNVQLRYVPLSGLAFADGNPKLHNIGDIAASIEKYGFRDPPIWDKTLNNGNGGIVAGNGRTEALVWMHQQEKPLPKGIATDGNGEWLIPVVFGCDAESEVQAKAFLLDHNSLTLTGGNFTAVDTGRMYNQPEYLAMLKGIADAGGETVTVDGDALDLLIELSANDTANGIGGQRDNSSQGNPSEQNCQCPNCGHQWVQSKQKRSRKNAFTQKRRAS
jgi:hypothetical protein